MKLTPNLNGTSREALIEQRRDVAASIDTLLNAMTQGYPHPRDYQLAPDGFAPDIAEWRAFSETLRKFKMKMELEAVYVQSSLP